MINIKEKIKNNQIFRGYYIATFLVASVTMYLVLSYSGVLSTGKYCLMVGDLWDNYIPAIRELWRDIITGQSIYYSWTHSLGMNTSLYNAYYSYSPLNVIYFLLYNVDVNIVTAIIIVLKTGFAAISFQLYSKKVFKYDGLETMIFSVLYSLCSFQVSYNVVNIIWLDALFILPLLLLSIHIMIDTKNVSFLILSYSYIFISNFYMGYILGLFSLVYFIGLLVVYKKNNLLKLVSSYIFSVFIAAMISALFWVPALLFLLNNNPEDGTNYYILCTNVLDVLFQLFFGQNNGYDSVLPNIYCGVLCIILFPIFFINKNINKKRKIFLTSLFLIVIASFLIKPLYALWHAFDAPDGWYNRFSFFVSFLVCIIGLISFERLKDISKKTIIYVGISEAILCLIYNLFFNKTNQNHILVYCVINIALIMFWILLLIAYKGKLNNKTIMLLILICSLELIANGYSSFHRDSRYIPSTPEYIYYGWEKSLEYVQDELEKKEGFYRVGYYGDVIDNSDTFFGYNGMADFGSAENPKVRQFLSKIGIYTSPRVIEPYGSTIISNMILGVGYEVEGIVPSYVEVTDSRPIIADVRNFGLAYMVDETVLNTDLGSNDAFVNNNSLLSAMLGYKVSPFVEIDKSKITVIENGVIFYRVDDSYVFEGEAGGIGTVDFVLEDENDAYIYFVNDKSILDYDSYLLNYGKENLYNDSGVLSISYIKPFESIEDSDNQIVEVIQGEYEKQFVKDYYVYYLDSKVVDEAYKVLSDNSVLIDNYDDGYIKGTVQVEDEYSFLFTTIPYDVGWSAKVDGESVDIVPLFDETFIGIASLKPGKHVIELKYRAKGVTAGLVSSVLGILIYCSYIAIIKYRTSKNDKGY